MSIVNLVAMKLQNVDGVTAASFYHLMLASGNKESHHGGFDKEQP